MSNKYADLGGAEEKSNSSPYADLGGIEEKAVVPEDVDPILYNSLVSAGETPERARERASNIAAVMKNSEVTATRRDLSEYEDPTSILGTVIENAANGLTFGLTTPVEGAVGLALKAAGWKDNPLLPENIEARSEANPKTALASEILAGVATGGAGALKTLAPKVVAGLATRGVVKRGLGKAITGLAKADIAGRVAGKATTWTGAKLLGTTTAEVGAEVAKDLGRIEAKIAAEGFESLSKAEQEIYQVYKAGREFTPLATTANLVSRPARAGSPVARGAARVAAGSAARADKAAKAERTAFVVTQRLNEQYDKLGWGKHALQFALQAGIGGAMGAVSGLGKTAQEELHDIALEDQGVVIDDQAIDATGETLGARLLNNVGKGTTLGLELGAAVPVAFKSLSLLSKGIRGSLSWLAANTIPKVGANRLTGIAEQDLERSLRSADAAAGSNIPLMSRAQTRGYVEDKLVRDLQYQHDNAEVLFQHLDSLDTASSIRDPSKLNDVLERVRQDYMIKGKDGKWVYNKAVVMKELKENPLDDMMRLRMPGSLGELQDVMDEVYEAARVSTRRAVLPVAEVGGKQGVQLAPFPERTTSGELPFTLRSGLEAYGPSGLEPRSPLSTNLDQGVLSKIPLSYLFDKKLQSEFAKRSVSRDLTELVAAGNVIGIAAKLAGASFPMAAGIGAGVGTAGKIGIDAVVNPYGLVKNYTHLQSGVNWVDARTNQFADFLVRNGNMTALPTKGGLLLEEAQAVPVADKLSLTTGEARDLYDTDKKLIDTLSGPQGIPDFEKAFSGDFDLLDATYPKLSQVAQGVIPRQVAFLARKMKEFTPNPSSYDVARGLKQREPTRAQLYQYSLYSQYVRDPDAIYRDIASKGYVPKQAIEVLTEVYPARYEILKRKILAKLAEEIDAGNTINPKQLALLDKIMPQENGRPISGFSLADIKKMQGSMPTGEAGKGGPVGQSGSQQILLETEGTSLGK